MNIVQSHLYILRSVIHDITDFSLYPLQIVFENKAPPLRMNLIAADSDSVPRDSKRPVDENFKAFRVWRNLIVNL